MRVRGVKDKGIWEVSPERTRCECVFRRQWGGTQLHWNKHDTGKLRKIELERDNVPRPHCACKQPISLFTHVRGGLEAVAGWYSEAIVTQLLRSLHGIAATTVAIGRWPLYECMRVTSVEDTRHGTKLRRSRLDSSISNNEFSILVLSLSSTFIVQYQGPSSGPNPSNLRFSCGDRQTEEDGQWKEHLQNAPETPTRS